MPEYQFHDPPSAVPVSGQTTAGPEFLMRLRIKHLATISFGITLALSRSDERHTPSRKM